MTEFVGPGQWPYEDPTAVPFGPNNQQAIAILINALAGAGTGYAVNNAARAALVTSGQAFEGLLVYDAQDDAVYKSLSGTTWRLWEQDWKTFTPVFPSGLVLGAGGALLYSAYKVSMGEVHCRVGVQLGTSGFSVSSPLFTPPLAIGSTSSTLAPLGLAQMMDSSAAQRFLGISIQSGTNVAPFAYLVQGTTIVENSLISTVPFTWAASDQLFMDITYPL